MKSIKIKSLIREVTGKTSTNSVRKDGNVPCVLYGGDEVLHFTATEIGFKDLVYTAAALTVVLDFGDNKKNAILQDIQFHPVSDKILHADFYEIHDDKPVTMDIPVELSGSAPGVLNSGGVLSRNKRKLRVRALPGNLPDSLESVFRALDNALLRHPNCLITFMKTLLFIINSDGDYTSLIFFLNNYIKYFGNISKTYIIVQNGGINVKS